jgi:galactokinase/mevalonate kinase-like predicted kinase
MLKEIITCILTIIVIFALDIVTQGYTKNSTKEMVELMANLKENILNNDIEQIENSVKEIDENWQKKHGKLAYYIEHDELEKVDTSLVTMKSFLETNDYSSAVAELDEGKFILEHIKEKNSFNVENIF